MKAISHEGMLKVRTELVRANPSLLLFKDPVTILGGAERQAWLQSRDVVFADLGNARYIAFLARFVEVMPLEDRRRF